ncbi:MAG: beta-ketoacyl-[acyl-carrier-protein] synthase family protein [Proteobacteria bacterium]|nr:beta-ketoacyl-[acyl-carrier-protein] synthase family protein [Pseudomonadota bacterium]
MSKRVVITGLGVISPNANGISNFEEALKTGLSGIRFIPRLEELNFSCRIGGIPKDFDTILQTFFSSKELMNTSLNIGYACVAAMEAWQNAGLSINEDETDWDTGAIIGCGVGDMETIAERVVPMVNAGKARRMGSRIVEQVMNSGISARIAGIFGLGNQVTSNSSACSTGTEAIIDATQRIRSGLAKRMLAGGSEGASPYTWGGFDSMRVLSSKFNHTPENGSRPMSASACGFVPGSGAGVIVLEDLETALERQAPIWAEIIGIHVNCGGHRNGGSMTAPSPSGVQRCIQSAIHDANISSHEIDAINGHLTATFADPYEITNWSEALSRGPSDFPFINSTKSMIGHCLGAAGAIETIAAVIEINKGFLHPSINCEDLHSDITPFSKSIVQSCFIYPELNIIAKASFGFGDVNSCLILKKWQR